MKANNAVKLFGVLSVVATTALSGTGAAIAANILDGFDDQDQYIIDNDADNQAVTNQVTLTPQTTHSNFLPLQRTLSVDAVTLANNPVFNPQAAVGGGVLDFVLGSSASANFRTTYTPVTPETLDLLSGTPMSAMDLVVVLNVIQAPTTALIPVTLTVEDQNGDVADTTEYFSTASTSADLNFNFAEDFAEGTFGTGVDQVDLNNLVRFDLFYELPANADVTLNPIRTQAQPMPFEAETSGGLALLGGWGVWKRWKNRRTQAS